MYVLGPARQRALGASGLALEPLGARLYQEGLGFRD